jgi:uncharacterized oxidoreductase
MKLSGNTVLITGGSGGIGFAMAKAFLAEGNKVIITGRKLDKLQEAKEKLGDVTIIQSDVSDPAAVQDLYQKVSENFPELNVLINNAGVMWPINLQDHKLTAEELTREIDINVKGPIWMNDAFLPLLKKQPSAATVSVSSGLAFVPLPITPVYSASKSGIHAYTRSLRAQLSNTNVKVFELAPPATKTDMMDSFEPEDMEGNPVMTADDMVAVFMKGLAKDKEEICPGQASQLKFMSRFFPGFIFKQLSKPVARMHGKM